MRLSIIFLFVSLFVQGQVVNDGANIRITETTIVSTNTDFLNVGNIQNEGNIFIKRNWMNVGVYSANAGQLIFNGEEEQGIINNGQEIKNLFISNGVKTLSDDLMITGSLTLSSGVLEVADEAKLTLDSSVQILGANESSYIIGELYRTGSGDLFYPIGTQNSYLPVTLNEVIGISPEIGIKAHDSPPDQSLGGDLEELIIDNFWEINTDEGYTAGFITLPFDILSVMDTAQLVVAQSIAETRPFNTLGKSTIEVAEGTGFITSRGNAIGPFFTLALAPEVQPLPPLRVINALTPIQDGKHDFLRIENIELYPKNQVEIFDRNGIKVFSISNYDNRDRVFRGVPNAGGFTELQDGNYFYTIKTGSTKVKAGFLFLKK
ncbi:T9SS type B sorting domain-containing protein [Ekhidna sp.]